MNRIELAASQYTVDLAPLENNSSTMVVSCTPAIFVATLVGTFAGAAVCYKVVHGFDTGLPDAAGEPGEHPMQISDLLSARKAAVAGLA